MRKGEKGEQGRGQESWGHPGIEHSGCVALAEWPNFSEPPASFVKGDANNYPTGPL